METKLGYIYMITSPSGKIYIGSTDNIKTRWSKYYNYNCKSQVKLYNSFIKYRVNNHTFEIIWTGDILYMLKYETLIGWGYNVLEKDIGLNLKLPKLGDIWSCVSNETKQKISNSLKGHSYNLGRKHSEGSKKKMSDSKIGNKCHLFGKTRSEEIKKKISESHKGKKRSMEVCKNLSKIRKVIVLQYDVNDNFIKEWDSALSASIGLNISSSSITQCCKGKVYKKVGGFKWKYKI